MSIEFLYNAPPTVSRMMKSDHPHRLTVGPVGSGKSVGCCVEVLKRNLEMPAWNRGLRSSKWAIVRNTMKELRNTTLETWMHWMRDLGTWQESKFTFHLKFGEVDSKILFLPLDGPGDIGRLLSLELTGIWTNEFRELPLELIPDIKGRLGRYPAFKEQPSADLIPKWYDDGNGNENWYWSGMIGDTNPPEAESGWFRTLEKLPQTEGDLNSIANVEVFRQPSGLSEFAENTENLKPGYYENLSKGQPKHWIDTYIHGLYSPSMSGRPVYDGTFDSSKHVVDDLKIDPLLPVIIGFDTGLTPAAVFHQVGMDGVVRVLKEAAVFDMGMKRFADLHLRPIIRNYFPSNPLIFIGDPAGKRRADSDESTAMQELKKKFGSSGAIVKAASTNDPIVRVQATEQLLSQYPKGSPKFVIDSSCKWYIEALRSKYRYAKSKMSGKFSDKPDKNEWSHIAEAGQYAHLFIEGGKYRAENYMYNRRENPLANRTPQYRPADPIGY